MTYVSLSTYSISGYSISPAKKFYPCRGTCKTSDRDVKVWQGSGGRKPPPDAPHLGVTTPEMESLRPGRL